MKYLIAFLVFVSSNLFSQTYALLTFSDDFSGAGTALSSNWSTSFTNSAGRIERRNLSGAWPQFGTTTTATGAATSGNGLAIYNTSNLASDNTLNADLYLRLQDVVGAKVDFSIVDWGTAYAANPLRIFISTNGGVSFGSTALTVPLNLSPHADGIWNNISVDLNALASSNSLTLSNTTVVRFAFTLRGSGNTTNPKSGNQFVYLDNVRATGSAPLPVVLLSFDAKAESEFHELSWVTLSEINNSHFEVQMSLNGIDFELIGVVEGHGTSNQINAYVFQHAFGLNCKEVYYRLKQVDEDGDFEFSNVKVLAVNSAPNFVVNEDGVHCVSCGNGRIFVYDSSGKLLDIGDEHFVLSFHHFSHGHYLMQFIGVEGSVQMTKKISVVKQ